MKERLYVLFSILFFSKKTKIELVDVSSPLGNILISRKHHEEVKKLSSMTKSKGKHGSPTWNFKSRTSIYWNCCSLVFHKQFRSLHPHRLYLQHLHLQYKKVAFPPPPLSLFLSDLLHP